MRNYLLSIFIVFNAVFSHAESDNILPSGTLPILYINTVDSTPVDQKEYYIDAEAWLDASMTDEFESFGSAEEPLSLGIRGRGNATWSQFEQKPYKLKFAKKLSIFGNKKSKHFALLHLRGAPTAYFHEPLAFYAAKLLGDEWVPSCKPCEVVLNGDYVGLYFFTETVRVEKDRVNITKQPDLSTDKDSIDSGWLVEIDNTPDAHQTILFYPTERNLRLTFKSPEVLSDEQLEYIEREFNDIIDSVNNIEYGNEDWLNLIDVHSVARHYILNEVFQNYDAFCGSFFLYKDKGTKWTVGPAWDYGSCLFYDDVNRSCLKRYEKNEGPFLIREMLNSFELRQVILEEWDDFYVNGIDWVEEVADDWAERIAIAGDCSNQLWGFSDSMYLRRDIVVNRLKNNMEWFDDYVRSDAFKMWLFSDIQDIKAPILPNENMYDILGRRIHTPSRGLYIVNGHKFVGGGQ